MAADVQRIAPCLTPSTFIALRIRSRTAVASWVYTQGTHLNLQECHCTLDTVYNASRFTMKNALRRPHIHPAFQNWDIVFIAHVIFRIQWDVSLNRSVSLTARLRVGQPRYRNRISSGGSDSCRFQGVPSRPGTYPDYPLGC